MSDPRMDPYEAIAYGRFTAAQIQTLLLGLDPELDATFPRQRAARVAITAKGKREEFVQPTRKGDPDLPLTDKELEEKFMELAAPVVGNTEAKALLGQLWKLECA